MFQVKVEFRVQRHGVFCDAYIFDNKNGATVFLQHEAKKIIDVNSGTYEASQEMYLKLKKQFPKSYTDNGKYSHITRNINYDFENHRYTFDKNDVQQPYKYTFDFRTEVEYISDAIKKLQDAGFIVVNSG